MRRDRESLHATLAGWPSPVKNPGYGNVLENDIARISLERYSLNYLRTIKLELLEDDIARIT